jgi:PP-loop superfamily ATP-utilizing enzyme
LRIEESEDSLRRIGFRVLRVRDHGPKARVEVGRDELEHALRARPEIERLLAARGFETVELSAYVAPAQR